MLFTINITFSYSFLKWQEKVIKKFGYITICTLLFLILILLLLFYLLLFVFNFYILYQALYNVFNATVFINDNEYETYITNFQCNTSKPNTNHLERFIELFLSDSSIKYFPSYFVDIGIKDNKYFINNFVSNINNNKLSTMEYIYSQQFILSNSNRVQLLNNMKDLEMLYNIYYEYSNDIKWIINNNPLVTYKDLIN